MLELLNVIIKYQENRSLEGDVATERFKSKVAPQGGVRLELLRSQGLAKYVFNKFEEQYSQKDFYTSRKLYSEEGDFIGWSVKRVSIKNTSDFNESHGNPDIDAGLDVEINEIDVPIEREVSSTGMCTCQFFSSWGIACRHVIHVSCVDQITADDDENVPIVLGGSVSSYWLSKRLFASTTPSSSFIVSLDQCSSPLVQSSQGHDFLLNVFQGKDHSNLTSADRLRIMKQMLQPILDSSKQSHGKFLAFVNCIKDFLPKGSVTSISNSSQIRRSSSMPSNSVSLDSISASGATSASARSVTPHSASAFSFAAAFASSSVPSSASASLSSLPLLPSDTPLSTLATSSTSRPGPDSDAENEIICIANPEKCPNKAGRPRKNGPKRILSKLDLIRGTKQQNKKSKKAETSKK